MKILGVWVLALFIFVAVLFPVTAENSAYKKNYAAMLGDVSTSTPALLIKKDNIEMVFAGDIMLSRGVGEIIKKRNDSSYPFLMMRDFLRKADIASANLENPISDKGTRVGSIYSFQANPAVANGLKDAGFDVLNLANNHIWDYGKDALLQTMEILKSSEISFVGAGLDYTGAHTPVVKEVRGTKIAFLGYTNLIPSTVTTIKSKPAVSFPDLKQLLIDIQSARNMADIVVVTIHWGDEYQTKHSAEQEKLAKYIIDVGADLVVGHHPHVVQEVEKYGDGYIAYSLGNFVFDQNFSPETGRGLIIKATIENKKIQKLEPMDIGFNINFQPFLLNK